MRLFHATRTANLHRIHKQGLVPQMHSMWVGKLGQQLGEIGRLYAFTDLDDAVRFAFRLAWQSKPTVVIEFEADKQDWALDPHPEGSMGARGYWLVSKHQGLVVPPQAIVRVHRLTRPLLRAVTARFGPGPPPPTRWNPRRNPRPKEYRLWWILPDGKLITLGEEYEHSTYLEQHPRQFGISRDKYQISFHGTRRSFIDRENWDAALAQAHANGAVRLVANKWTPDTPLEWGADLDLSNSNAVDHLISTLHQLGADPEADEIIIHDASTSKEQHLPLGRFLMRSNPPDNDSIYVHSAWMIDKITGKVYDIMQDFVDYPAVDNDYGHGGFAWLLLNKDKKFAKKLFRSMGITAPEEQAARDVWFGGGGIDESKRRLTNWFNEKVKERFIRVSCFRMEGHDVFGADITDSGDRKMLADFFVENKIKTGDLLIYNWRDRLRLQPILETTVEQLIVEQT